MDQDRGIEIALGEHRRDMFQMHSNLCATLNIVRAIGRYLNGTTPLLQQEMMCGLRMVKAQT